MIAQGQAWVFGDGIDTDVLAPGVYMKHDIETLAAHCMEAIGPDFAATVQRGDILVAGANFGQGSAREQAPQALHYLGVSVVLAKGVARIFYRNALNLGLPVLILPQADEIAQGDRLHVDLEVGTVLNLTSGRQYQVDPIPNHLLELVRDGGLMPHLKKQFAKKAEQ